MIVTLLYDNLIDWDKKDAPAVAHSSSLSSLVLSMPQESIKWMRVADYGALDCSFEVVSW